MLVGERLGHPRAEDERLDLLAGEGEWRQLEPLLEAVAHARLAPHRDTAPLQIGDVPVDGARAHLELGSQRVRRRHAAGAQELHELEQAIRATHQPAVDRASPTPPGRAVSAEGVRP